MVEALEVKNHCPFRYSRESGHFVVTESDRAHSYIFNVILAVNGLAVDVLAVHSVYQGVSHAC